MNKLPTWIPSLNSWMSAILLLLLLKGITKLMESIWLLGGDFLMDLPIKTRLILYFLALLSPILLIAVVHHFLHGFLDRFFPNSISPEIGKTKGFFPGMMSWWEGLFGWQTMFLANLVSSFAYILFAPFNSLYNTGILGWWEEIYDFLSWPKLVWIITAAYLYQFEHLVRNHLMSLGSNSTNE